MATTEGELLETHIRTYVRAVDRDGDADRIAHRVTQRHAGADRLVGFRRRAREVLFAEPVTAGQRLRWYTVGRDGQLTCSGQLWRGTDLAAWLREHHHYLEWVPPWLRHHTGGPTGCVR